MAAVCKHLDSIQVTSLPENVIGCEDCLRLGGWWVHLRLSCWCYEDKVAFTVELTGAS